MTHIFQLMVPHVFKNNVRMEIIIHHKAVGATVINQDSLLREAYVHAKMDMHITVVQRQHVIVVMDQIHILMTTVIVNVMMVVIQT